MCLFCILLFLFVVRLGTYETVKNFHQTNVCSYVQFFFKIAI